MSRALRELTQLPFPVIAAVNGDAIGGGCEILTACDLRIAAAHARFRFPQDRLGLTTGWGGTGRLVRLIGQSRASDWLLTGRTIDAHVTKMWLTEERLEAVRALVEKKEPDFIILPKKQAEFSDV